MHCLIKRRNGYFRRMGHGITQQQGLWKLEDTADGRQRRDVVARLLNFKLQLPLHLQIDVHKAASAFAANKMHCVVKPSPWWGSSWTAKNISWSETSWKRETHLVVKSFYGEVGRPEDRIEMGNGNGQWEQLGNVSRGWHVIGGSKPSTKRRPSRPQIRTSHASVRILLLFAHRPVHRKD